MLPNLGDPNNPNRSTQKPDPLSVVLPHTPQMFSNPWTGGYSTMYGGASIVPVGFSPYPNITPAFGPLSGGYVQSPAFNVPYNPLMNVQSQPPQAPYNPLSSAQAPQSAQNVSYNPLSSANAGKTNNGKVGVSGGIGTANVPGNAGNGVTQTKPQTNSDGSYFDSNGNKRSSNRMIDFAYLSIDGEVGKGFTDSFMQKHGVDPISFYMRAFTNDKRAKGWEMPGAENPGAPGHEGYSWLMNKAANAATNDARFLPGAVAEWQKVHGNAEIPPEQWDRWWSISQSTGGYPMNVGEGQNAYGVY